MEMKKSKVLKIILGILGMLLIGLGAWRLFDPITFFENSDIVLQNNSGLLNEARSTGGVVVGFGMLIIFGAFKDKLAFTSTIAAMVLFYGFAVSRLIGFVLDGNVVQQQLQGAVMEIIFGSLALFCFYRFRLKNKES